MNLFKTIGNLCLVFLCMISIIVIGLFIYFRYIDPDKTIGVNNFGDQVALDYEKYTGGMSESEIKELEDRMLFEINVYTNENLNGITMYEFEFNYFTTWELKLTDYRSSGYQLLYNYPGNDNFYNSSFPLNSNEDFEKYIFKENIYEKTFNHLYWNANNKVSTGLNRNTDYIVKIDNEAYTINLNKTYITKERLWGFLWYQDVVKEYTFANLMNGLFSLASQTNNGEGSFYVYPDLSKFFTVKKFNSEGVLEEQVYTDIVKNYACIKVNFSNDGAFSSSQSLFEMIDNNPNFDLYANDLDTDYWASSLGYNLTCEHLNYRYSELYGGYFVSLSQSLIVKFNEMARTSINVLIDLDSDYLINNKINVLGFDYNAFNNIEINQIYIKSDFGENLTMLDNCLDSSLNIFKYSDNIDFSWVNSEIPSGCEEVVVNDLST